MLTLGGDPVPDPGFCCLLVTSVQGLWDVPDMLCDHILVPVLSWVSLPGWSFLMECEELKMAPQITL